MIHIFESCLLIHTPCGFITHFDLKVSTGRASGLGPAQDAVQQLRREAPAPFFGGGYDIKNADVFIFEDTQPACYRLAIFFEDGEEVGHWYGSQYFGMQPLLLWG